MSRTGETDYEIVEPDPAALIESLRSFGYSLEAAIADLVDNSVTAGATHIDLTFEWSDEDSYISLLDNGTGINEDRLSDVMRPGSSNPLDDRKPDDLGRFGLGLKTASFSQARSLTVVSKNGSGSTACRRWDLDHVGRTREWQLLKDPRPASTSRLSPIDAIATGTIVLWENMDRVIEDHVGEAGRAHFYRLAARTERHLAAVFHRFIAPEDGLVISLNGNVVEPWDPFCSDHVATQRLPEESLRYREGKVRVRPFVLPHHNRFDDKADHERAGGINGWNAQQGFYIYRGGRLILSGGWIVGGFKPEEHCKLGRISIDIDQTMDADWAIDVKKSRARPPAGLIDDLERIARATRSKAEEVYRHRGTKLAKLAGATPIQPAWTARKQDGFYRYRVNRKHPIIEQALKGDADQKAAVRAALDLVEQSLPVERIVFDGYRNGEAIADPSGGAVSSDLQAAGQRFIEGLVAAGESVENAKLALLAVEPFSLHPEIVEAIS